MNTSTTGSLFGVRMERIYERYASETKDTVTILVDWKPRVLQRDRMYNSQIDLDGMLYTDYVDRGYKEKALLIPKVVLTSEELAQKKRRNKETLSLAGKLAWKHRKAKAKQDK